MKQVRLTLASLLALTAAASGAFAQDGPAPPIGRGTVGPAPGVEGNVAAPGPGGDVAFGYVAGGTLSPGGNVTVEPGALKSRGNVTVFRGAPEHYRGGYGPAPSAALAAPGAEAGAAASANDKTYPYPFPYHNGEGACWNPYYGRYSISLAPCAAYPR
jgi:hypothetical protein